MNILTSKEIASMLNDKPIYPNIDITTTGEWNSCINNIDDFYSYFDYEFRDKNNVKWWFKTHDVSKRDVWKVA